MRRNSANSRALVAMLAALMASAECAAQRYTLTQIAGPSSRLSSVGDGPSISDAGAIAFQGGLAGVAKIFRAAPDGTLTTIASVGAGPYLSFDERPSIDRLGDFVVFRASTGSGTGVFAGGGGAVTTIALPPVFVTGNGSPAAQPGADGAAVFVGFTRRDGAGIYLSDGGEPTLLAGSPQELSNFGANTGVNASGAIAFRATMTGVGQGVFLRDGGVTTTLAALGPVFSGFAGSIALNDQNRAAFRATLTSGAQAIIVADAAGWNILADTSGAFATFNVPAINDAGEVVFRAMLDSGEIGIFTGPDAVADRIMLSGQAFDGSTVDLLDLHSSAINARGQIAFRAILADGAQEIVRADPPPCPADVVLDRKVNVNDLLAVIASWGACPGQCPPHCNADILPDCTVNVNDLLAVIGEWGACP